MPQDLTARVLPGSVRYELRVSSFTPDGSFAAATEHLDHLARLGVDVVELAPERPVEAASGLAEFVVGCHQRGLAVLLGLPQPVTRGEVRQLFIRYRLDGVRAPAVSTELVHYAQRLAVELGRPLALLPASDLGPTGEHALHALLAGDMPAAAVGSPETLADVLHEALLHAGSVSRGGHQALTAHHFAGTPESGAADRRLVRVGVTLLLTGPFTPMLFMGEEWGASGHRAPALVPAPALAPALALTGPVPVRRRIGNPAGLAGPGRWVPRRPGAPRRATAQRTTPVQGTPARGVPIRGVPVRAGLDWSEPASPGHAELLDFYQRLIALRRANADLADPRLDRVRVRYGDQFIAMRRGDCGVVANLAATPRRVTLDGYPRRVLLASEPGARLTREAVDLPAHSAIIVSYA